MVNAALQCGNPEYMRSTIEMVDKHTQVLRKGGVASPSSQNRIARVARKEYKRGICGSKGHNRASYRARMERHLVGRQTESFESYGFDDEDFAEENYDCTNDMDVI
ncbi:hypothetical protein TSUD_59220 [Trifolium subterraneum]|uniref:Uncharacterized protein n=1 Tax=Trifolium subterraneum TaxID=3900 RepID=A0A2Z6MYV6_TRISU|nr:hypothetical protein TSUD_59220 [Trifolium subterraneum]